MSSISRIMSSGRTPLVPGCRTTTSASLSRATYFLSRPMKAPGKRETAASTLVPGMASFRTVRAPSMTESPMALRLPFGFFGGGGLRCVPAAGLGRRARGGARLVVEADLGRPAVGDAESVGDVGGEALLRGRGRSRREGDADDEDAGHRRGQHARRRDGCDACAPAPREARQALTQRSIAPCRIGISTNRKLSSAMPNVSASRRTSRGMPSRGTSSWGRVSMKMGQCHRYSP